MKFLIKDKTTSQDLNTGVLNYTTDYTRKFKLEEIMLKFDGAVTEIVTITLDSINGSDYDVVLALRSLVAETSFVFRPQGEANYQVGDNIKIQCTNANLLRTVYVTVKASELP